MKILVLNYEWPPLGGGGGPVAEGLARGYVAKGHEVHAITMRFKGQPAEETRDGVHLHRVRCLRKKMETCETLEMLSYVASAFLPTLSFVRRHRPDVIHCHFAVPTGMLALAVSKLTGLRYVLTCHGSDVPGYNPQRFNAAHRFTPPILRRVLGGAHAIVAPSHAYLDHVKSKFPRETEGRSHVIYNGIPVDAFATAPKDEPPMLLMTGRLLHRKGFIETLQALETIDAPVQVHIAGDGPARAEIEAAAARLRCPVVFHGWVTDPATLRSLYARASILSLASENESAGMSLIEAMASRVAVISSNISGCAEMVGTDGILVRPRHVDDLRAALARLLQDPHQMHELAGKGLRRAREVFDIPIGVDRYLQLLASAARDSARKR